MRQLNLANMMYLILEGRAWDHRILGKRFLPYAECHYHRQSKGHGDNDMGGSPRAVVSGVTFMNILLVPYPTGVLARKEQSHQ